MNQFHINWQKGKYGEIINHAGLSSGREIDQLISRNLIAFREMRISNFQAPFRKTGFKLYVTYCVYVERAMQN